MKRLRCDKVAFCETSYTIISHRYASFLMGISRGFGLIAGIVSSTATGFLIGQVGPVYRAHVRGGCLGLGGGTQLGLCSLGLHGPLGKPSVVTTHCTP